MQQFDLTNTGPNVRKIFYTLLSGPAPQRRPVRTPQFCFNAQRSMLGAWQLFQHLRNSAERCKEAWFTTAAHAIYGMKLLLPLMNLLLLDRVTTRVQFGR